MTKTTRQYETEIEVLRIQFDQSVKECYEKDKKIAELIAMAEASAPSYSASADKAESAAAAPDDKPKFDTVCLDGHQLRIALDLINPDGLDDREQLDDYLYFGIRQHRADDGAVSTGMCCWNDDTDGVLPLDGEYEAPEYVTQAAAMPGKVAERPMIGKLLDDMSQLQMLWGLNEPGALVRFSDVSKILFDAAKAEQPKYSEDPVELVTDLHTLLSEIGGVPDDCYRVVTRAAAFIGADLSNPAPQQAPAVQGHELLPEDIRTDDALWRAGCKAFRSALNEMTGRDGYVVMKTYDALRAHILANTPSPAVPPSDAPAKGYDYQVRNIKISSTHPIPQEAIDAAESVLVAREFPSDYRNDDPAEAAFWRFDARHKGYGRWKNAPQSERDAFKSEYRIAIAASKQDGKDGKA